MMMNVMNTSNFRRLPVKSGSRKGFTLMELLTVMAIVSILLTVASVGVSRIERGSALTSALAVSEGIFSEAKTVAIAEGVRTRVVIHNVLNDEENPERYLRYMAVAVQQKDNDGEPIADDFQIEARGVLIPAGVFFDVEASTKLSQVVGSSNSGSFGTWGTDNVDFPALPKSAQDCYFYEFNAEGLCVMDEAGSNPGAAFVLSDGNRPPNREPILDDKNKSAFVIWRNGSTSLYKDTSVFNN